MNKDYVNKYSVNKYTLKSFLVLAIFSLSSLLSAWTVEAANLSFANTTVPANQCTNTINILIDPEGSDINASDLIITYDPTLIEVVDLQGEDAFEQYFGNTVDNTSGEARLIGVSPNDIFSELRIFASIEYKKLTPASSQISIEFTSAADTFDSNVARESDNLDILSSVSSLNLPADDCEDGQAPEEELDELPETEDEDDQDTASVDCVGAECFLGNAPLSRLSELIGDSGLPEPVVRFLQNSLEDTSVSSVTANILLLTTLLNLLTSFSALRSPILVWLFIVGLFQRKRRPWGLILDIEDSRPIPFAAVRMYEFDTDKQVETKVSDLKGRYNLIVERGKYKIEVAHPDYETVNVVKEFTGNETSVNLDILMSRLTSKKKANKFRKQYKDNTIGPLGLGLYIFGIIISIAAYYFSPILINAVIIILYILQFLFWILIFFGNPRNWGEVKEISSQKGVPLVNIKVFDKNNWTIVDTQMTNKKGQFGFFLDKGNYALQAGTGSIYELTEKSTGKVVEEKGSRMLDLNYNPRRPGKIKVWLRRLIGTEKAGAGLDNPFS